MKSFNIKRKFGDDIINKEYYPNFQENKINNANSNKTLNSFKKENNHKNETPKKNSYINSKNSIICDSHINININENKNNPQFVDEYIDDIIKYIIENESINILNYSKENIFKLQDMKYINEEKRKQIIELLFYYNYKWKLNPDSVYLAINIMDRYINIIKINNNEYELIALASFLISSKYEDIYSPNSKSLSYIYSFKYEPEEILKKENQILNTLNFSLLYQSSFKFLNLLYHLSNINNENVYYLSQFILELSLTDLNIMKYSQRKRAIGAFIFAKKAFGINSGKFIIRLFFSYNENEIKKLQRELFIVIKNVIFSEKRNLIAEKFRSSKYGFIFTVFEKKLKEKVDKKKNNNRKRKIMIIEN